MTPSPRTSSWAVRAHILMVTVALGTMNLQNTAYPVDESGITGFIPLCLGLMVWSVAAAFFMQRSVRDVLRDVPRRAWACVGAATALFGYAFLSTQFRSSVVLIGPADDRQIVEVPLRLSLVPLTCGLLAVWAAFVAVIVVPQRHRFSLLWWFSLAMVPWSLLGWWRTYLLGGGPRLWTQAGGAAVFPVMLVVAMSIALAGAIRRHHPRVSQLLVVVHMIMLLLTGSRGSLVMIGVFVVLLWIKLRARHTGWSARLSTMSRWVFALGGVAVLAAAVSSPLLGRLGVNPGDRLPTWQGGIHALDDHPLRWAFGLGWGTIWPWFAYESGWQVVPWASRIVGPWGPTLYHGHSLYLGVLVELGLVGVLLLSLVLYPVVATWIGGGPTPMVVLTSGVVACLVGFAFDTYLFKNFPVAWVWWLLVFAVLSTDPQTWARRAAGARRSPIPTSEAPTEAHDTQSPPAIRTTPRR
ncbi:O-antigen ligase family protein [Aestuariimicrobium ganziense]|uniref:O-antigen ligase family protein n=1 Tax=Aestuariimicrobium ganziense TaxID=2773677 RepID=UPI00194131B5|nr:hypothetical protein [Aestuariimicrobium ganziense]